MSHFDNKIIAQKIIEELNIKKINFSNTLSR